MTNMTYIFAPCLLFAAFSFPLFVSHVVITKRFDYMTNIIRARMVAA